MNKSNEPRILKIGKSLSEKDVKEFHDMLKLNPQTQANMDSVMQLVYSEAATVTDEYNKSIDRELEAVYRHAVETGIIKGEPTRDKFEEAGYDLYSQQGVGTYIRRNGVRVSEIVPWPVIPDA